MLNGEGQFHGMNGVEYDGEWKNNLYHGKGLLRSEDQSTYEGNFENGVK